MLDANLTTEHSSQPDSQGRRSEPDYGKSSDWTIDSLDPSFLSSAQYRITKTTNAQIE